LVVFCVRGPFHNLKSKNGEVTLEETRTCNPHK